MREQLSAEPRIQRQYHYSRAGHLVQTDDVRHGSTLYHFDPIGRLLAASGRRGTERFAFDPANNLLDGLAAEGGADAPFLYTLQLKSLRGLV